MPSFLIRLRNRLDASALSTRARKSASETGSSIRSSLKVYLHRLSAWEQLEDAALCAENAGRYRTRQKSMLSRVKLCLGRPCVVASHLRPARPAFRFARQVEIFERERRRAC
jgi:hypothetical protein